MEQRGISEEELLTEMRAKGIEVEDLENLTPSQLVQLEAIVAELEAKNKVQLPVDTSISGRKQSLLGK